MTQRSLFTDLPSKPGEAKQNKYGVIVLDPAWSFDDKLTMEDTKRGSDAQYATMSHRAITELDVISLGNRRSVCGLWCPASLIHIGLGCLVKYGYVQKQIWTWVKTKKAEERLDPEDIPDDLGMAFGMGRLARNACEFMLVGTRGVGLYDDLEAKNIRNVFLHPALPHSAKPEIVQDAFDAMFPSYRKVELFARRDRPGWVTCGDECPSTEGEDVRESIKRLQAENEGV